MKALLLSLPLAAGAGAASPGAYRFDRAYTGEDFFSQWRFFTEQDPSKGSVRYVGRAEAASSGLTQAFADRALIRADSKTRLLAGAGRPSVRIESAHVFNAGLFVVRLEHVPTGCGSWPAFWLYGEDNDHIWPAWGEYDVIEGVHTATHVMTTLHTSAHCDQSKVSAGRDFTRLWMQGTSGNAADSCDVDAPDQFHNQGCSQRGPAGSIGTPFNVGGGGTYAAEWDPVARHIRTWFWPGSTQPPDLRNGFPEPDSWGTPYSFFSLDPKLCSADHFVNMRLVFSLTFCGDLGAPKFAEMCPEAARTMTCEEFVASQPEAMMEAYWSIRSLEVYQKGAATGPPRGGEPLTESPVMFLSDDRRSLFLSSGPPPYLPKLLGVVGLVLGLVVVVMLARAEIRGRSREGYRDYRGLLNIDDVVGTVGAASASLAALLPWRPATSGVSWERSGLDTPARPRVVSWDGRAQQTCHASQFATGGPDLPPSMQRQAS